MGASLAGDAAGGLGEQRPRRHVGPEAERASGATRAVGAPALLVATARGRHTICCQRCVEVEEASAHCGADHERRCRLGKRITLVLGVRAIGKSRFVDDHAVLDDQQAVPLWNQHSDGVSRCSQKRFVEGVRNRRFGEPRTRPRPEAGEAGEHKQKQMHGEENAEGNPPGESRFSPGFFVGMWPKRPT